MRINISKICLFLFVFLLPFFYSCRSSSSASRQKQVEHQREEKDKEALKMYNKAKEKHLKNQSRQTRRQMKINKMKSENSSNVKKECFLKRWFGKKPNSCPKS